MGDLERRTFLQIVSGALPAVRGDAGQIGTLPEAASKFTMIDLAPYLTASATDFGPRDQIAVARDGTRLLHTPGGRQVFRGIPFALGPEDVLRKSWLVLTTRGQAWTVPQFELPWGRKASHVCLVQFCDWDGNETQPRGVDDVERVGQRLAEATFVFEDGTEIVLPIRRRFEVNAPSFPWGHWPFASVAYAQLAPATLNDPLRAATQWGNLQTVVQDPGREPFLWLCALENPRPEAVVKSLRLRATSEDPLVICGITLFHGRENPLRYERLTTYRIAIPEHDPPDPQRWRVAVDLGVVARTYFLNEFDAAAWLAAPDRGLGERGGLPWTRDVYAEVTANAAATLVLEDITAGRRYTFPLAEAVAGHTVEAQPLGAQIEFLYRDKVWLHGRILDSGTGRPTPARVAFRSKEGRYIPPYGHRTEINPGWFQDYGGDVKLGDSSFAYVDGEFQIELPAGEVYVEIVKGFEYEPLRQRLDIQPQQRQLEFRISRQLDLRSRGWITADTHVHFLSPSTAVLEGQAEGLNLINLLAAQWGDLYTNVGDLSHGPLVSKDRDTIVWVGTENRSHLLGHIGLLGVQGEPVYPLSGSFPSGADEAYFGDPLWTSMAAWADTCRDRGGLTVAVHFPYPTAEIAADIVLGKIDAIEVFPSGQRFNTLRYLDWYRCLNCGYRLPVVGGTDKMRASTAVGANRTYAFLGNEEFNFVNWAKAVRAGNTFMTSGPLLLFQADGHPPGHEVTIGAGGGTLEILVEIQSHLPVTGAEIIFNGEVVARHESRDGLRRIVWKDKVRIPGPGWLAARCASIIGQASRASTAAHTSPVYVRVPGEEVFSAPAAAYLLNLIEGTEFWVNNLATRPDSARFERIREVLAEARRNIQANISRHAG